jgi:multiple sugar transport system substrate-binding protein
MKKVTRRTVLKTGTALAGGMAGILATGRAPAFAQGTTINWIRWNDFVPASDQLLRRELIPEGEKTLGIKINLETVNGNDLQPRITAAIQSGAGPDVFMLFNNHPQLYAASLARPRAATIPMPIRNRMTVSGGSHCRGPSSAA